MTEVNGLIETDRLATLSVNGSDSLYWDGVATIYTSIWIWIPLALIAIFLIIRNVESKKIIWALLAVALTVVLCDQLSSGLFKPLFHRLRPTRDPFILDRIDTVNGYIGGLYGFFSGHAANSFGLAVLLMWLIQDKWFCMSAATWALINSLIRVYLGVHFAGDIIVGAFAGCLIGTAVYWTYRLFTNKYGKRVTRGVSLVCTPTGFRKADVFLFMSVLFGTWAVILTGACITQGLA